MFRFSKTTTSTQSQTLFGYFAIEVWELTIVCHDNDKQHTPWCESNRESQSFSYHGWAPLLLAAPATSQQHATVWVHRHSAAPTNPPALYLHSIVCNPHIQIKNTELFLKLLHSYFCVNTQLELYANILLPVCLEVVLPVSNHVWGSGQDGVAENLPRSLQLLWRNLQNTMVVWWTDCELAIQESIPD